MPADRPGPPDPLPRLADVLGRASSGDRPTPLELAELLWLAGHIEPADRDAPDPSNRPHPPVPADPPEKDDGTSPRRRRARSPPRRAAPRPSAARCPPPRSRPAARRRPR
ncbi:hypothetical protein EF919_36325, partial [Streptomyces sp. WAC02707]